MEFDKLMNYQKMVQERLRQEQQQDKKIDLLSIINQLTQGPKNMVQKEQVLVEAASRGIPEEEVHILIAKLISDNIIYEDSPGYLKKR
jgi:DNA replicative helicase MCM subunit Mcm2 (Cdc46/Mcm family)